MEKCHFRRIIVVVRETNFCQSMFSFTKNKHDLYHDYPHKKNTFWLENVCWTIDISYPNKFEMLALRRHFPLG